MIEEITAKVRVGQDPLDVVVIVRKVECDDEGLVVAKYGLSGVSGEWLPVPEGQAYPDECLLPVQVWRDKPGTLPVREFAGRE